MADGGPLRKKPLTIETIMRSLIYPQSVGSSASGGIRPALFAKRTKLPLTWAVFFQRHLLGLIHPCAVVLPPAERNAARHPAHPVEAGAATQTPPPASIWRRYSSNLGDFKLGRIVLHLLCFVRTGHLLWHWHGILRELHS